MTKEQLVDEIEKCNAIIHEFTERPDEHSYSEIIEMVKGITWACEQLRKI